MKMLIASAFAGVVALAAVAAAEGPPPPPNALPAGGAAITQAEWYVSPTGQSVGPKSIAELIEMAKARTIVRDTPVWKDGWAAWKLLGDVAELQLVAAAIPTSPTPPPAPPNVQGALEEKTKAFLIGDWKFEGDVSTPSYSAYAKIELLYRTDGTYAGSQSTQFSAPGGMTLPAQVTARQGRWSVIGIDDANFVLRLLEQGNGPTELKMHILSENSFQNSENLNTWYRVR